MAQSSKGLGKGLSALLGEQPADAPAPVATNDDSFGTKEISISSIVAWNKQPRKFFAETELEELSSSIKKNGVVQPIIVRAKDDGFEIIAGERRWRAAKMAGIKNIPAVVMDLNDERALEIALIENIQRQDLKPLEMAESYATLIEEHGYTQEKLAETLGKSRSQVTNTMRLMGLPESVKTLLNEEKLTAGHARALVGNKNAEEAAAKIVSQNLSVRQTEQLIKKMEEFPKEPSAKKSKDPEIIDLEKQLSNQIGIDVSIDGNDYKGKVVLKYSSIEELDSIIKRLQATKLAA